MPRRQCAKIYSLLLKPCQWDGVARILAKHIAKSRSSKDLMEKATKEKTHNQITMTNTKIFITNTHLLVEK